MKKTISFFVCLLFLFQITIPSFAYSETQPVTAAEKQALSAIAPELCAMPEITMLKNAGALDAFLKEVNVQKEKYLPDEIEETMDVISAWDILGDDTVVDVAQRAQAYLDAHFDSVLIGTPEFDEMVRYYIETDAMPTDKMAKDDPAFGPLYLYMCIYDAYILADNSACANAEKLEILNSVPVRNIVERDCEANFADTQVKSLLRNYVQAYSDGSVWPALNGESIQTYARRYADTPNTSQYATQPQDCTNFVSQALFYGGLPMTYTASDLGANGFVETDSRWFYKKNSSPTGYSASTSWVRVVELYNYLSPHYAVYETTNGSEMTPYLNKGFVLQGKPFIGSYHHSVIVTFTEKGVTYSAHSSPRNDEPISTFYNGFYKYRVIQTY